IRVKLVRIRKSLLPAHPHTANKEFLLVLNSLFQQNLTPVLTYLLSHASHFQNRFVPSVSINMLFSAVYYRRVQSYQKKDSHCSISHNNTRTCFLQVAKPAMNLPPNPTAVPQPNEPSKLPKFYP